MSSWQEQARRPSYAQVLRQLKRRECGLYNCINSVLADAAFVREIAALYPGFPVLANLRCGLWYVPEPAGTCYFKSTDGHFGKWAFSLTRLNLHLARLAAREGGVLIVDATRRGKTFPVRLVACAPSLVFGSALAIAVSPRAATRHLNCVTLTVRRTPSRRPCPYGRRCSTALLRRTERWRARTAMGPGRRPAHSRNPAPQQWRRPVKRRPRQEAVVPAALATTPAGRCPSWGPGTLGTSVGPTPGGPNAAAPPARRTASRRRLGCLAGALGVRAGPAGAAGAAGRRLLRRARGAPTRHRQQRRAMHVPAGAARQRLQGQAAGASERQQPQRRLGVGTACADVDAAAPA